MRFVVLKSSFDGISGGESRFDSIDEVIREVSYSKGWPSQEAMHAAIRKWAGQARPGSVFSTQVTAIVATAVDRSLRDEDICHHCDHEGLDYEDVGGIENGDLEQEVSCPECGKSWVDVFALSDRRELP